MNPYNNTPYNYQQNTPGPPQPAWQAPPRRGWADPRLQQNNQPQSPVSPYNVPSHAFGPPLPLPVPQHPPQGSASFNTSAWGVRYNQGLDVQGDEPKPPLPPRPVSAAGRVSPQPDPSATSYTHPGQALPITQYTTTWSEPYHSNLPPTAPDFSDRPPPPPPPRPAEYQAQIEAYHTRISSPNQEYSHQVPTHHYDPFSQSQTGTYPTHYPTQSYDPIVPAPQQSTNTNDAPLVSPIDGNSYWAHQGQSGNVQTSTYGQNEQPASAHALPFGGPADWEYYGPLPTDQTSTSPANRPAEITVQAHDSAGEQMLPNVELTSAQSNSTVVRPSSPIEIGAASPMTPRKNSSILLPTHTTHTRTDGRLPVTTDLNRSDTSTTLDSVDGTANIDSIIQAWNTPLKPKQRQEEVTRPESHSSGRVASPGHTSPSLKIMDPYEDLEPEFKASLKRYATMLRKESSAETDEEKFDVFQSFVNKELRLRSLLYGVMLQDEQKEVKKVASLANIQPASPKQMTQADSGIPVKSSVADIGNRATTEGQPPSSAEVSRPHDIDVQRPAAGNVSQRQPPDITAIMSSKTTAPTLDSDDEEGDYSPGGRPRIAKKSGIASHKSNMSIHLPVDQANPNNQGLPVSPGINAPMVVDDYVMAEPPSPAGDAPILVVNETPQTASSRPSQANHYSPPIKFEPSRPAYTPFRYSPAAQEGIPKTLKPADEAYSSLRHSVFDSGRLMTQDSLVAPIRPTSASGRKEHEEAFIGLIRQQSTFVRQKPSNPGSDGIVSSLRPGTGDKKGLLPAVMRAGTPTIAQPVDTVKDALNALKSLLPSEAIAATPIEGPSHPKLKVVRNKMESIIDDFGFIHATVVDWDKTNREVRKEQEAERQSRLEESEAHIDGLFNDNEIGYADIGALEAQFKLSEAERRYQENQEELESFARQVYKPVAERLEREIAELNTAYTMAIDLLDLESEAVSRCLKNGDGRASMADVMGCVLLLFNKLEIRHRKVSEAKVERERRRKHLELTVLYTNGDTAGVRKLEKEFAVAEKMQVLHEARAKDDRANKMMDRFDRAAVRGLGDNQTFIDDLVSKLKELKKFVFSQDEAVKDKMFGHTEARGMLDLAQNVVETVMRDSRKLLALSNEADVLLNDADYGISVAEARVANAEPSTYGKLEQEKAKEDTKLVEEMNTRVNSVTQGPRNALVVIKELVDQLGNDPERQDRLQKALEAAKRRNGGIDGQQA